MSEKKRLFIAVKILPEQQLIDVYNSLRNSFYHDRIKWVKPDNFHLTLKFLGDTYESDIPDVSNVIEECLKPISPFEFDLRKVGVFGSRYNPRVIWIGIEEQGQLRNMGSTLINELDKIGFKKDRQNFVPHLTIARIKNIVNKGSFNKVLSQYAETYFQSVYVNKVCLYESVLTKEGPIYKVINNYVLI